MSLRDEIERAKAPRYLFFSGKGGVGKTSMSSVTAVWLAGRGNSVLHVSTDLQKSLNDIYEQEFSEKPTPVAGVDNLQAVNIETAESMERHRGKIMETLSLLDPDSLLLKQMKDDYLTDCGCAQAAIFELVDYLNTSDYDYIVFDTAPASSSLQKIETQSRSVLSLVKQIDMKKAVIEAFGGDDGVKKQIAALEAIRQRDQQAFDALRSDHTVFTMILIPEALPFAELQRNIDELEQQHRIPVEGVIINNVLPEAQRTARDFWKRHWEMQERYIKLVYETYSDRAIAEVPLLETETIGISQLTKLGHALYGGDDS